MKESIKQSNTISPNSSIILLIGDLSGHNLGTYSPTTTIEVVNEVRKKFNNIPIVITIGNNEVVPWYYSECNDHTYELYYKILSDKIPTSKQSYFLKHGSYIRHFNDIKISILSINTILYNI